MAPMALRMEALGMDLLGMPRVCARRRRSVCVVALIMSIIYSKFGVEKAVWYGEGLYLKGSPTTKNATSSTSAR